MGLYAAAASAALRNGEMGPPALPAFCGVYRWGEPVCAVSTPGCLRRSDLTICSAVS